MCEGIKYVYRYVDVNRPGDGHAEVVQQIRPVIKETPCYLWHVSPYCNAPDPFALHKTHPYYPKKTRKDAYRSAWHTTPEAALTAWRIRKSYQLTRLRLMLERVELCVAAVGAIPPDGLTSLTGGPVVHAPDIIYAGHGPEIAKHNWQEY